MAYEHSFAKVWLDHLGNTILINGKDFFKEDLDNVKKEFTVSPLKTFFYVGQEFTNDVSDNLVQIYYPKLLELGIGIYRRPAGDQAWLARQQIILYFDKYNQTRTDMYPEPSFQRFCSNNGNKVLWDKTNKRIRGLGHCFGSRNGRYGMGDLTPWFYYDEGSKRDAKNVNYLVKYKGYSDITEELMRAWDHKPKQELIKVEISGYKKKEMPVALTEESNLLCMPFDKDYVPKMIQVGTSGGGKSFCMNSILGRAFYIFNDMIGLLNDSLDQFYDLMLCMKEFEANLRLFGNEPKNLPVVNMYMSGPGIRIRYKDEHAGFRYVVPFKKFLYQYKFYSYGIQKWDLGKPEKYLSQKLIVDELYKSTDAEQVKEVLFSCLENTEDKGIQAMIFKWKAAFENIFKEEFTSNLFKNEETTAEKWVLKDSDGNTLEGDPFIVAMYAGLIPVLNNSMVKDRPIAKKQVSQLMHDIVTWQMKQGDKKKRVWIAIDELRDMLGRKGDDVYNALDYLFSQGRFPKIGFIGNVQEYSKMSNSMRNNTTHLMIFTSTSNKERKLIAEDYGLEHSRLDELSHLDNHQCLFITRKKMIIYSPTGQRKEYPNGGIWRVKIVPPISVHKKPSD
jgi:hypothetical protein